MNDLVFKIPNTNEYIKAKSKINIDNTSKQYLKQITNNKISRHLIKKDTMTFYTQSISIPLTNTMNIIFSIQYYFRKFPYNLINWEISYNEVLLTNEKKCYTIDKTFNRSYYQLIKVNKLIDANLINEFSKLIDLSYYDIKMHLMDKNIKTYNNIIEEFKNNTNIPIKQIYQPVYQNNNIKFYWTKFDELLILQNNKIIKYNNNLKKDYQIANSIKRFKNDMVFMSDKNNKIIKTPTPIINPFNGNIIYDDKYKIIYEDDDAMIIELFNQNTKYKRNLIYIKKIFNYFVKLNSYVDIDRYDIQKIKNRYELLERLISSNWCNLYKLYTMCNMWQISVYCTLNTNYLIGVIPVKNNIMLIKCRLLKMIKKHLKIQQNE